MASYQSITEFITSTKLFSSFLEAKNMFLQHENHEDNHDPMLDPNITTTYNSLFCI